MTAHLSLVTPSLNQRAFLEECLAHVRVLGDGVEHIVCDGGSSDGTVALLEEEARARGERLCFRSAPDGGMYEAVNAGMALARGDVVGYVNCDDVLLPWAAEVVLGAFAAHPQADVVVADALEVRGDRWAPVIHPPEPLLARYLKHGGFLAQPAVFMRRACFERHGPFDASLKLLADHDLWLRLVDAGARLLRVAEIVAVQRMVAGQLMERHAERAEQERLRIMSRHGSAWRRPGDLMHSFAHRVALLAFLRDLAGAGGPRLWPRARASGYWRITDVRQAAAALISSSRTRTYLQLTEAGRRAFGERGVA